MNFCEIVSPQGFPVASRQRCAILRKKAALGVLGTIGVAFRHRQNPHDRLVKLRLPERLADEIRSSVEFVLDLVIARHQQGGNAERPCIVRQLLSQSRPTSLGPSPANRHRANSTGAGPLRRSQRPRRGSGDLEEKPQHVADIVVVFDDENMEKFRHCVFASATGGSVRCPMIDRACVSLGRQRLNGLLLTIIWIWDLPPRATTTP